MFGVAPFLQLISTNWNTANPLDVIAIWQLDGMANMFTVKGDCSICSLSPVFPHKLEGVPSFIHLLRNINLHDGHGIIRVILERIILAIDFLIHRNTCHKINHLSRVNC